MSTTFNRRRFFKSCAATAIATTALWPARAHAANKINYWMHGFDEGRYGEETLLRKAMNVLSARFQDRRVWQNVYDLGPRYYIAGNVMENSNLIDNEENCRNLLWHQVHILSLPNSPGNDEPPFPHVHLNAYHEESEVLGRAALNEVTIKYAGNNTYRQLGEFKVDLNRYQLGAGGEGSDPEWWAGTIAHEMLHNLGHKHEENDYTDEWQINVFKSAVVHNGYYRK